MFNFNDLSEMINFNYLLETIFLISSFLLVLSVHEAAHAGMAFLLGDDTAKRSGRISLNPLKHIDPFGLLFLIFFKIGWAKPVMFNYTNFKYPKLYSVFTALAGPTSNFVLALFLLFCTKILRLLSLPMDVFWIIFNFLTMAAQISVMLGVFNLMPIPPLDGSHTWMVFLVDKHQDILRWIHTYSFIILIGLFVYFPPFKDLLFYLIDFALGLMHSVVF
jgi:Zn-dependent protease